MSEIKGIRVLVVEDELALRRFLRTTLTAREFVVEEAETLRQAKLLVTSHPPEIILLDLGLPDGDGIDFTRE
ncbi:MAG: response regulator, partial [Magnetococcales bacterium]|nr:response regulator [Magnetococcales bacterium]